MSHRYPITLDVTDRLAVIVGGGAVALRKAKGLIAGGAQRIRCIAPQIHPDMPAGVQRIEREFVAEDLQDAGLVFAATDDPAVNDTVVAEARRRGVLVNRADSDEELAGDFSVPAMMRRDHVIVSISTEGSPALAAQIRNDLLDKLDERMVDMAGVMSRLRPAVLESGLSAEERRELFRSLVQEEALRRLQRDGEAGLRSWIASRWKIILQRCEGA